MSMHPPDNGGSEIVHPPGSRRRKIMHPPGRGESEIVQMQLALIVTTSALFTVITYRENEST
jgi:hypothetical protein